MLHSLHRVVNRREYQCCRTEKGLLSAITFIVLTFSLACALTKVGTRLILVTPESNPAAEDPELMERLNIEEGAQRVANLLRAMTLEIQMLARACGKSDVHHLEPEDMAALSLEASAVCGIPLAASAAGHRRRNSRRCRRGQSHSSRRGRRLHRYCFSQCTQLQQAALH